MKIIVRFTNSHWIKINILNSSPVKRWFEFARNVDYKFYGIMNQPCSRPPTSNILNYQEKYSKLINAATTIKQKYNHKSDLLNLPPKWDGNQNILNQLHRFFTYHATILKNSNKDETNLYDSSFKIPNDKEQFFIDIDKINMSVHSLESNSLLEKNAVKILQKNLCCHSLIIDNIEDFNKTPKDFDTIYFDEKELLHNQNFDLSATNEYPVVLSRQILGKCILQSFFENDDPTQFDCTGRLLSFGSFFIDLDQNRRKIYKSKIFKKWCNQWNLNINNLPLEFQIGWVEKFSQEPTLFLDKSLQLYRIEFIS